MSTIPAHLEYIMIPELLLSQYQRLTTCKCQPLTEMEKISTIKYEFDHRLPAMLHPDLAEDQRLRRKLWVFCFANIEQKLASQ